MCSNVLSLSFTNTKKHSYNVMDNGLSHMIDAPFYHTVITQFILITPKHPDSVVGMFFC